MGYIGITKDRVKKRWWQHKKDLKLGKHANIRLQNAYDKYGFEAFEYKILQVCNSIEELGSLEKETINREKHRLYNIREGGYENNSFKHTEETKKKIGELSKKAVVGMSIETGEIKEYPCSKDTQKDGINHKNVGKCCKLSISNASGRIQMAISTNGWVWMHKSDFNIEEMNRRRELALKRGKNDQSRAIIGKSLIDGSIIEFNSCLKAGQALGCHGANIRSACLWKESKTSKGYVWVFLDEPNPTILLEERYNYGLYCRKTRKKLKKD